MIFWFGLVYLKVKNTYTCITFKTNKDKNTEKSRTYFHGGPLTGSNTTGNVMSDECACGRGLLRVTGNLRRSPREAWDLYRIWVEDRRGEILGGGEGEREGDMVSSGTGPPPDAGRPRGTRALQQEAKGPGWKRERH